MSNTKIISSAKQIVIDKGLVTPMDVKNVSTIRSLCGLLREKGKDISSIKEIFKNLGSKTINNRNERARNYRKKNIKSVRNYLKSWRDKRHFQVLSHYSNGSMKCACCGESNIEFLTIDHIDNNGAEHRREIGHRNLYNWLIKNNFPPGFQVLCHNCNFCKGRFGVCYHNNFKIKNSRKRHTERRLKVLSHYAGNPPKCACCGESIYYFLAIDHINGGGRKQAKKTNNNLIPYIIKNNFPPGYRVLCHNCNFILGHHHYCPHNKTKSEIKPINISIDKTSINKECVFAEVS